MENNREKRPARKMIVKKKNSVRRESLANENTAQKDRRNTSVSEPKNTQTDGDFKRCPVYKKCGGCQLQNMDYKKQLSWKQGRCVTLLGKFARVEEIIGMNEPYHYRNKVQAAFGVNSGRAIVSGVYQSSTHRIVPIDSCMTEDKKADEIIVSIRKMLKDFKLTAYDERAERGFLRHVLVKRGFVTNEIMVVLVTSTPVFPAKNHFVKALLKKHPEINTIVQNINDKFTSMLLGKVEKILYGSGTITDELCGYKFRISAKSFYQINPVQTEILYKTAIDYADLTGEENVLDAYCGIGTIGIVASKKAKNVMGVEVNKDAVRDAIANAKISKVKNIYFYAADATEFMADMHREQETCDVVFMDPPRAGSTEEFIKSMCELAPKKIVYISCNPETLARDLASIKAKGYEVKKIQPVDMFPHTNHVECVVLMSRAQG